MGYARNIEYNYVNVQTHAIKFQTEKYIFLLHSYVHKYGNLLQVMQVNNLHLLIKRLMEHTYFMFSLNHSIVILFISVTLTK